MENTENIPIYKLSSTEETTNYFRIILLIVDVGTETLLHFFYSLVPKNTIRGYLTSKVSEIDDGKKKKIFDSIQYAQLTCPDPNPDNFDISLLIKLINYFKLSKLKLDSLQTIRIAIVGHKCRAKLPTQDYESLWVQLECILLNIARCVSADEEQITKRKITELKEKVLDVSHREKKITKLFEAWSKEEMAVLHEKSDRNQEEIAVLHEMIQSLQDKNKGDQHPQSKSNGESGEECKILKKNTDLQLQNIYERAIQEGSELDKHIRVIIVGNVAHGKTTLTRLLLGQSLDGIESTNGIYLNVNYCTNSETGQWESIPDEDLEPIVRMAQESDLLKENTEFITHEPKHISASINSTFQLFKDAVTKRSASDNSSNKFTISIWDFGGHLSFYATHQLFHSRNAIYLLVTNMSTDLNDKMHDIGFNQEENLDNRKCLQFWVDSIHSHVGSTDGKEPPIFLVGTFMDLLENEEKAKQYMLDIRKMFSETNTQHHIQKEDFAIGKTRKYESEIVKLRKAIVDKFQQTNRFETPLKWIPLERAVKKIRGKPIITINELSDHNKSTGSLLENMEQLKAFLLFHHDKGTFIYYDEEHLSNCIVIQPQYLIDSFTAIITSEHFWEIDPDLYQDLHPDWEKLYKEAHLTMEFLDSSWGQSGCKFLEQKEILILFLERSRIISHVFVLDENTNEKEYLKYFLVPSLLKVQISLVDLAEFLIRKESTMVSMVYKFRNSGIVPTAYQRLTAAALGQWPVVRYKGRCMIFKDVGMYQLNNTYAGIINVKNDMIELRVINLCGKFVEGIHGDKFRRFAEFIIENEFGKLRSCVQNSEIFHKYVRCFVDNHKTNGSEELYQLDQLTGNALPCPGLLKHDISVTKALNEWFLEPINITNLSSVVLSEKHFVKLANAIGRNWEHLAISFLNMDRVQVEHITVDYPDNTKRQILAMLTAWKKSQPSGGTLKTLSEALQKCERKVGITVNWSVIKDINDGFQ